MLFDLLNDIRTNTVNFQSVMIHLAVILMMIFLVLPVHEFAHAGVAYLLGDKNIAKRGRPVHCFFPVQPVRIVMHHPSTSQSIYELHFHWHSST